MWNCATKNVNSVKDATVLYLPGSLDLDRPEAIRRGFKPANLIAIERDLDVAKHLRKKGVTTIVGTLNDVIKSWPINKPIDLIIADFQCGITDEVAEFIDLYTYHPALWQASIVVNCMRGRDQKYTELSTSGFDWNQFFDLDKYLNTKLSNAFKYEKSRANGVIKLASKRMIRCAEHVLMRVKNLAENLKMFEEAIEHAAARGDVDSVKQIIQMHELDMNKFENLTRPKIFYLPSYKSSQKSPVFDSVLINLSYSYNSLTNNRLADLVWSAWDVRWGDKVKAGAITAALAIRTRRLRGELRANT